MIPDKVLHFLILSLIISILLTLLKKDTPLEIAKGLGQNMGALALLITFFCGVLQVFMAMI